MSVPQQCLAGKLFDITKKAYFKLQTIYKHNEKNERQ